MAVQPYYSLKPLEYNSNKNRQRVCSICRDKISGPPAEKISIFSKWKIVAHLNGGQGHPKHLGCAESWSDKCPDCRIPTDLTPVLPNYKRVIRWINNIPPGPLRGVVRGVIAIGLGSILGVLPRGIYHQALCTIPLPTTLLRIILPIIIVYSGKPLVKNIRASMEKEVMGNIGIAPQVAAFGSVVGAILNLDYRIGLYAGAASVCTYTIGTARVERGERFFTTFAGLAAMQCIEKLVLRFILQAF